MTTENENIPKLLQNIAEAKDKQERESLERTNLDYGFYHGDCMEYLPDFPDNYFDLAIVDPPYGAGFTEGGGTTTDSVRDSRGTSRTHYVFGVRKSSPSYENRRKLGEEIRKKNHIVGHSPETGIFRATVSCLTESDNLGR